MTYQAYPIVAVVKTAPLIFAQAKQEKPCLNGLVIAGRPSLGLVISEHTIIV